MGLICFFVYQLLNHWASLTTPEGKPLAQVYLKLAEVPVHQHEYYWTYVINLLVTVRQDDPVEGLFRFPSGLTAPGGSLSYKVGKGNGFDFSVINKFFTYFRMPWNSLSPQVLTNFMHYKAFSIF